jgi:hypothetical protein
VTFNVKIAGIAAGSAFVLSFLLSLISGTAIGTVFLKAFIFAVVFFVLAAIANAVFQQWFSNSAPAQKQGDTAARGEKLDISVGDNEFPLSLNDIYTLDSGDPDKNSNTTDFTDENESVDHPHGDDFYEESETPDKAFPAGLEQNNNSPYNMPNSSISDAEFDESAEHDIDTEMDDFIPGLPGMNNALSKERESPVARTAFSDNVIIPVEQDTKRSINLKNLGKDLDSKKAAGAIQNLLKKDKG